jgi:hypothetical protein
MTIDWLKLAPALLLLLTPISLFHGKKVRVRPIERDWDTHWPQIAGLGLHWIDLGRAVLGAWLLLDALSLVPGTRGAMRYAPLAAQGAVLIVASCLQCFVCKERDSAHAPFMFVTGLILGFYPPTVAGFSILLAVTAAAGSRTPWVYFPLLAVLVAGLGFLFVGRGALIGLAAGGAAVALPWLLTLMFRQTLVLSYRTRRSSSGSGAATSVLR